MNLLDDVKLALRVTHDKLDTEVNDCIEEARFDLIQAGVSSKKVQDDKDPLIRRAIKVYCKANFGLADKDTIIVKEKYQESYEMIKQHLSLSGDYRV